MSEHCRATRERLSEHLDGELAAAVEAGVRAHLAGCADCRRELELLRLTIGALRRLPELPAPAGILAGVRERLRPEPWYRRLFRERQWLVGIPIGAVATLLVVVGVSLFQARYPGIGTPGAPGLEEKRQLAAPSPAPIAAPAAVPDAIPKKVQSAAAAPSRQSARMRDEPAAATSKDANAETGRIIAENETAADRVSLAAPAPVRRAAPQIDDSTAADRNAAGFAARKEEQAPPRVAMLPPAPAGESATSGEDTRGEPPIGGENSRRRREAAIGALEARPRTVTSLRELPDNAPGARTTRADAGALQRTAEGTAQGAVAARRQNAEFRTVGAPDGTDRDASGVVDLGAAETAPTAPAPAESAARLEARLPPAVATPLRIVCLLTPESGSLDELKRLLRREGAGAVVARTLEPRAVREAFAPHRSRFSPGGEPARGWSLRAEIAPRLAGRLLDALANQPGVRILEYTELTMAQARQPEPLLVRLTVLR